MTLCRFTLTPLSPWAAWFRSDTLYGLICWYVAECEGDNACQKLIDSFLANRPLFELSSVMPANYLPMPVLPPLNRKFFRELASGMAKNGEPMDVRLFDLLQKYKKFRKARWLPLQVWEQHRHHLSARALFLSQNLESGGEKQNSFSAIAFEPHVSIDRKTGSAMEGQLFFMRLHYFDSSARFHLYARTDDVDYLLKYLKLIGEVGFGRDAGTGNGQFEVEPDNSFKPESLDVQEADSMLLLSVCAAQKMEKLQGYYHLEVKRGKTGPGHANPFKNPFLMLQEGSLLTAPLTPPFVLSGINEDPRIVQIMQPLNLPCVLRPQEHSHENMG